MSFWEAIWLIIVSFAFVAYLMIMLNIVIDLFRDDSVSGVMKAVWVVLLILLPLLTSLAYLVVRGGGMAERQMRHLQRVKAAQDDYIRTVATASPSEQVAQAQHLLESGAITQAEFDALKAKALA
jgi:hypothetical protein